jgi:protein-disulfide isomerase
MSKNKHKQKSSTHHEEHENEACCNEEHNYGKKHEIIYYSIVAILVLSLLNLFFLANLSLGVGAIQTQLDNGIVADLGDEGCEVDFGDKDGDLAKVPTGIDNTFNLANADDDAVEGSADAPVTIIEFSDYECPFCERFYSGALPQIREEYVKTGKVKIVFRDFPLAFHENAQKASEAAECSGEQDKYYEMHDKIFENQSNMTVADLKKYAGEIGLNQTEFDACLDSGAMASEVQKDFSAGQALGVSGTPSFFINGQKLVGAQPFSAFKQIIDAELAK